MAELSDAEKAVQLISPGFKVGLDDPDAAVELVELGVGGFCLYAGDVESVAELTTRLQSRARRPLLFNADYEDGLPSHCAGGTPLPANMGLGAADDEAVAERKGAITAAEARAVGVHWVLGPVCDLATNPKNPIVNVRSYSDDPQRAGRLARAYLRGLRSQCVLGCLKHFPGHGETKSDSHLDLPAVEADLATLERRELAPFAAALPEADSVMTGHLVVPALTQDGTLPYSLSSDVARTLRGKLGFSGLVSTDALNMGAVAGRFDELDAARRALLGGSDILLVPADPRALARSLSAAVEEDAALREAVRAAYGRLERARAAAGLSDNAPAADPAQVGTKENMEAAEALARRCLAWSAAPLSPLRGAARYWEPEADGPDEWLGGDFVAQLQREGLEVRPYDGKPEGGPIILGCVLGPHAYTGIIEYDEETRGKVSAALRQAPGSLIVSFGSPFVFDALGVPGLCAFSRFGPAQRAAAGAVAGRLPVTGRMPVRLGR